MSSSTSSKHVREPGAPSRAWALLGWAVALLAVGGVGGVLADQAMASPTPAPVTAAAPVSAGLTADDVVRIVQAVRNDAQPIPAQHAATGVTSACPAAAVPASTSSSSGGGRVKARGIEPAAVRSRPAVSRVVYLRPLAPIVQLNLTLDQRTTVTQQDTQQQHQQQTAPAPAPAPVPPSIPAPGPVTPQKPKPHHHHERHEREHQHEHEHEGHGSGGGRCTCTDA